MWLASLRSEAQAHILFAGTWRPLVSVITTLYYVAMHFHCRVWYRALSLCYACIQSSGIILIPQGTFVPNFISLAASIAELAHGEKSHAQSITYAGYLMPWEQQRLHIEIDLTSLLVNAIAYEHNDKKHLQETDTSQYLKLHS